MENIGRYQIVRELGRGAMGVVYLAQHPSMDRMVALKTFRAPEGDEADVQNRDRLLAEADRAGSLDHPNIVKVYDVDENAEPPFIVMEFVDGPTLDQLLAADPPDSDLSISILRQAAEALDYAHNQGIIHRDIKPANLMLDSKNTVKITDFGIAKRAGASTSTTSRFMGTPEYMSPEQLEGRPDIDGRTDQFALATIAYKLVTGRKPFEADTVTALSHLIANKNPVPPSQINRNLSKQVDAVISKALSKSRDRRYTSCMEFTDALELALIAPARRAVPIWAPIAAAVVLLAAFWGVGRYFCWFGCPVETVAMSLTPSSAVLYASETQQFTASEAAVQWSISPPDAGTVSQSGLYKAPGDNATVQSVILTATGGADKTAQASATIQLLPAQKTDQKTSGSPLSVAPARAVIAPGESAQFAASAPDVKWSISPGVGTISAAGLYRSPVHNGIEQRVTVTAASRSDSSLRAAAELLLTAERRPAVANVAYTVQALSRDIPIPKGAVFGESDERLGYLGIGQLRCRVKVSGGPGKTSGLRLVWYVNGDEMSNKPVAFAQGQENVVSYGNQPEPAVYRIKLMAGPAVQAETTFTIQRGTK